MQATSPESRPDLMPMATLLPLVGSAVRARLRRAAMGQGLTPTSMDVLALLRDRDAVSHRELAAHLRLTPGTLTPVVDDLEARGALRRERDAADRRVVRLWITEAGRDLLAAAFAVVAAAVSEAVPNPPPEHGDAIRRYLLAVLAAAEDVEARP